ncbi:hypothetical protein [Haloarchaeobius sp. HRN-SO-5]|uniref:hypothetical protein n=1 Tax=Haloarchaeobius sp. HRN-SO-5 TaxID=3446118 RepID=UPI003EBE1F7C
MQPAQAVRAMKNAGARRQMLRRSDWTLIEGQANQEATVAEYQAQVPTVLRGDSMRLAFTVAEEFTSDGSGTAQTFNLANDVVDTPNTSALELYSDGNRVQPDSVDYTGDSFDYTDGGAAETLHAFYVPAEPVKLRIERVAPTSQGTVSDVVFNDISKPLHERNQNKEPPTLDIDPDDPLGRVVPKDWKLRVVADGPIAFSWDDSDEATSNGDTAVNAMLSVPVARSTEQIDGLSQAVKQALVEG